MSEKRRGSNTQYFLLTQSNRIIRGHLWPKATLLLLLNQLIGFLNTGIYMFHIIQKNLIITNIIKCLNLQHKNSYNVILIIANTR